MTGIQNLYFALGEMVYAIAKADGDVQKEEKEELHKIVSQEIKNNNIDFDYSEIIFTIMGKDNADVDTSYDWAIKEMKVNSHYLDTDLKEKFISIARKVAEAFPPITNSERRLLERFENDLKTIH